MNILKVKRGFEYLLIFVFVIIIYFKNVSSDYFINIFEAYYSYWVLIISTITSFLYLNIGDILYFVTFPLIFCYLSKSKTRRFFLYRLFLTIIFIYSWFYMSWGFNYTKQPIAKNIDYKYNINELLETTDFYIDKINTNHIELLLDESEKLIIQNSFDEIVNECKKSFEKLDFENFNIQKLKVNKSYFSKVLSYMGFTGYINPFTVEANINYKIPIISYPSTISHEIAHQIGYASENEANYIGILSNQMSSNLEINYSGNLLAIQYLLSELYYLNKNLYSEKIKKIRKGILKNIDEKREFSKKYRNPFEDVFKKIYDFYLKSNNQSQGIKSYGLVVNLLIYDYQSKIKDPESPSTRFLSLINS